MNLTAMVPHPELASPGYCLAHPGVEYLVFQPKRGEAFSVSLERGAYGCEWFNASTSAKATDGRVETVERPLQFNPPFGGEAVLYLKAQ